MIVVDAEFSGLDPVKHGLLSIGAVDFDSPENIFYEECQLREDAETMAAALVANGFSLTDITNPTKPTEERLLSDFIEWVSPMKHKLLVAHVPILDQWFIRKACDRYKRKQPFRYRTIDLHSIAVVKMINAGHNIYDEKGYSEVNLAAVCGFCGIPEEPKPHNALNGAKAVAECFSRLVFEKPLLKEYFSYPIPDTTLTSVPENY